MAILSDHELYGLISSGRLKIEPPPLADSISPSTIDLRLDNEFIIPRAQGGGAAETSIDTRNSAAIMAALAELRDVEQIEEGNYFELRPGQFVLAWTREQITLPAFLSARIEGRSTLARLGLSVHQSAPTVHPTYNNRLQLELTNAGPFVLKFYPGHPICQLIVETMSLPPVSSLSSVHQLPT